MNRMIRANMRPDTPEQIEERHRDRMACEMAVKDREARYPTLTAENAGEAMAYQEERIRFHRNDGRTAGR